MSRFCRHFSYIALPAIKLQKRLKGVRPVTAQEEQTFYDRSAEAVRGILAKTA